MCFMIRRAVTLGAICSLALLLGSCKTIPGQPYVAPVYDPVTGEPVGIGFGWMVPFHGAHPQMDSQGESQLLLTTRLVSINAREYVLTCHGGPGDSLEWTASTPTGVISQLEDIAEDTYMILPTDQTELDELQNDLEDWITSEWMTPNAYHAWTGR